VNAKQAINIYQVEHFIETGKSLPGPNPLPDYLKQKAAVLLP
jgi:hypothetical protein